MLQASRRGTVDPRGAPVRKAHLAMALSLAIAFVSIAMAETDLPFKHKVETYRNEDGDVVVFSVLLEQPFLAEEFEKSNYIRLRATSDDAFLIYPRETRFHQKHTAFYGRLQGHGTVKLKLLYETVSETIDGSRKVELREGEIEVPIPEEESGPEQIYHEWARQQNTHFRQLLGYYPHETFLQYCLLQSESRYGVRAPSLPKATAAGNKLEQRLYEAATGSLAIQASLQRQVLTADASPGALNVHISHLQPPQLGSLDYATLLAEKRERDGIEPKVDEIARLIPADQYYLHFRSAVAAGEALDLVEDWGGSLLRLFAIQARDDHLEAKFERQLCLDRAGITALFESGALTELALTGSDLSFASGTDLTMVLRAGDEAAFEQQASQWFARARQEFPELVEREFNYRGHQVAVRYTDDRAVSSFVVHAGEYVAYSNSHVAIRKLIDALTGAAESLIDQLDYQYVTTILPPAADANAGYLYASEAFLKRQTSPALKISQKRRTQCFNNLVMLNNASLFHRLETGRSPATLSELISGRFIDAGKLVCPHGGTYAFDAQRDTGTCSAHNRLKLITPNAELTVLKVSEAEQQEYARYKVRYEEFWKTMFDPIAIRIHADRTVKLEVCVLPMVNGGAYAQLRAALDERPSDLLLNQPATSTIGTIGAALGRPRIADLLQHVPGIAEVLAADPTLTDLAWIGDSLRLHVCDADTILEVDPTQLRTLNFFGEISIGQQATGALAMLATSLPTYVDVDIEDGDKALRFLDLLCSRIYLEGDEVLTLPTAFDAYRLPDYLGRANYVLSFRWYALKIRLYVAMLDDRLVAATTPRVLREVIDASELPASASDEPGHLVVRLDVQALSAFRQSLEVYWAEKARQACHENIMSIYNLVKLYDTPIGDVNRLADVKYGVTYYCPDGGEYEYDAQADQVRCTVHGNRRWSQQTLSTSRASSFSRFVDTLATISAKLRFAEDSLTATVVIERRPRTTQAER